jgi:hypothetical protein
MKSKGYRKKEDTLDELLARIRERQDALRRAISRVLSRVTECIDVDGGIFENVLC